MTNTYAPERRRSNRCCLQRAKHVPDVFIATSTIVVRPQTHRMRPHLVHLQNSSENERFGRSRAGTPLWWYLFWGFTIDPPLWRSEGTR
jgi:hypothetical protein